MTSSIMKALVRFSVCILAFATFAACGSESGGDEDIQVKVAAEPSAGGQVSVTPKQESYAAGDEVTLVVTPNAHYAFNGWSGDFSGFATPLTWTINEPLELTATFGLVQHKLDVQVGEGGSVSQTPDGTRYEEGATVTLTATPDAGYRFAGWAGDITGSDPTTQVTMDEDRVVIALFTHIAAKLTFTVSPAGTGSVTVSPVKPTYYVGDTVTITATNTTGYGLWKWTGDLTGSEVAKTVTLNGDLSAEAAFRAAPIISRTFGSGTATITATFVWPSTPLQSNAERLQLESSTSPTSGFTYADSSPFGARVTSYTFTVNRTGTTIYYRVRAYVVSDFYPSSDVVSVQ